MKVAVIGFSGAGKSTLAQRLGEKLSLPVLHLDTVHWLPGWQERDREERLEIVSAFLDENSEKGWVIDGNYSSLLHERRMAEADIIVFLDYPALRCFFRAWKRAVKFKGKTRPSMTVGCDEKFDLEFMRWILFGGRNKKRRAAYESVAEKYPQKFIRCRNDTDVEKAFALILNLYYKEKLHEKN